MRSSRIYRSLLTIIIVLQLLGILYFALPLLLNTPVVFLKIGSDSMQPAIHPGDLVLVNGRNKDLSALRNQTVAVYDPTQDKIIVHRVVANRDGFLVTKGDNSTSEDFFKADKRFLLGRIVAKFF